MQMQTRVHTSDNRERKGEGEESRHTSDHGEAKEVRFPETEMGYHLLEQISTEGVMLRRNEGRRN